MRQLISQSISRKRGYYLVFLLLVVVVGISSRKFAPYLPHFLAAYAGDTLWALLVFLGLGFLRNTAPIVQNALLALAFSYAIEVSQFYQADWINAIRHTTLGALVLGFSFLWSDLVCYTCGILLGASLEWLWFNKWLSSTVNPT
ncbi:MAG: DUF2809 domain-containing protein [Bacteroidota bacterium]